jgi:tetratricopeptide (TPR) repeat protein
VPAIYAATLLAYFPALRGALLWNDHDYVTQASLQSLHGLKLIWFQVGATEQYYPLLHTAFWVEHRLWGDAPLGYHLVNVLLHATSACLLAMILRRWSAPGAWLAAGILALHPVCVESVAWISEQKNTLSTVFYLLAAHAYLRFEERSSGSRIKTYLLATALFSLALATKTTTATLPAALLVVLWWRHGVLAWKRDVLPLAPWLGLGAAAGVFSGWVERRYVGAVGASFGMAVGQRLLVAGRVVWFYLGKLLWPQHLNFIYPRWSVSATERGLWLFPIAVGALTFVLWLIRGRYRGPLAAWLFFVGSLFPVLGFLNVYAFLFSYVADHFQYLAAMGVIAFVSAALALLWNRLAPLARGAGLALGTVLLVALGTLTWRQCGMYRDLPTFYSTILERNPACWMAHNNLGNVLRGQGHREEAIQHYQQALRLRPDYPDAHLNLALALADEGRIEDAVAHEAEALRLDPLLPGAREDLGTSLLQLGRIDEAIAQFAMALQADPDNADARYNLGTALEKAGRFQEAISQFTAAIRLNPLRAAAHHNLANALLLMGRDQDAAAEFAAAVRLQPDYAEAHNGLGSAYFDLGRLDDARAEFAEAVRWRPSYPQAHNNLGSVLARLGRNSEAVAEFMESLRLDPKGADANNNLAIALDQMGRISEAAEYFQRALRLQPESAAAHNNFGNVLRQLDRINEARAQYQEALRIQPNYPEARESLDQIQKAEPGTGP